MSPLDQRVTITVTAQERAQASLEASQIEGGSSLAELIRRRATSTIDLLAWKKDATEALELIDHQSRQRDLLRRQVSQANREIERLIVHRASDHDIAAMKSIRDDARAEYLAMGRDESKRSERLIGRLTYEDREQALWEASCFGLTLSDYLRMKVFNLSPGQRDKHLSPLTRRRFYERVIQVSRDGLPPQPRRAGCCASCGAPRK